MFSRSTMRKAFLLVSVLALVIIGPGFHPAAESAPLQNMPVTVKQPNGAVLHLYASGDEHYNWLHDKEGYTIIQDPVTGYFVYAVLDSNGDLVSSGFTAGSIHPKSVGSEKRHQAIPGADTRQGAKEPAFAPRVPSRGAGAAPCPEEGDHQ